jgi:hypothetical protein
MIELASAVPFRHPSILELGRWPCSIDSNEDWKLARLGLDMIGTHLADTSPFYGTQLAADSSRGPSSSIPLRELVQEEQAVVSESRRACTYH